MTRDGGEGRAGPAFLSSGAGPGAHQRGLTEELIEDFPGFFHPVFDSTHA